MRLCSEKMLRGEKTKPNIQQARAFRLLFIFCQRVALERAGLRNSGVFFRRFASLFLGPILSRKRHEKTA
jgi:hypothetical protein